MNVNRMSLVGDKLKLKNGAFVHCIRPVGENSLIVWNGGWNMEISMNEVEEHFPRVPDKIKCSGCKDVLDDTEFETYTNGTLSKRCRQCVLKGVLV